MGMTPAKHHRLLISELEWLWATPGARLAIFMPPGSAKSTYTSQLFPAWVMAQGKPVNVIGASHSASLAEDFSRRVQSYIEENQKVLGFGLERQNAELWSTNNGCHYRAAGVGGAITGFRADLAIIDDPVKSRKDAESVILRDDAWNWFTADLLTRARPGMRIVVVQTRWHQDDLGGRLLASQPDLWRVVNLPATALENDPLGRAPGELLWQDDPTYPYGALLRERKAEYEKNGAMRDWAALYEQTPTLGEGGIFQTGKCPVVDVPPPVNRIVRAWDLAGTEQFGTRDPDWTVGVKMGVCEDGRYAVLDVVRFRAGPDEVLQRVKATAAADGRGVRISIPREPAQSGKMQVLFYTRQLAGYTVVVSPVDKGKEARATPFASQVNVSNVVFCKGHWTAQYLEELNGFPGFTKDDCVDASSDAFNTLVGAPPPIKSMRLNWIGR